MDRLKKLKITMGICIAVLICAAVLWVVFYNLGAVIPDWLKIAGYVGCGALFIIAVAADLIYDNEKKKLPEYSKKENTVNEIWYVCILFIAIHTIFIIMTLADIQYPYMDVLLVGFSFLDILAVPGAVITSFIKFKPKEEKGVALIPAENSAEE